MGIGLVYRVNLSDAALYGVHGEVAFRSQHGVRALSADSRRLLDVEAAGLIHQHAPAIVHLLATRSRARRPATEKLTLWMFAPIGTCLADFYQM
jgi:hypothetical protein